jgi:hypothetical protein
LVPRVGQVHVRRVGERTRIAREPCVHAREIDVRWIEPQNPIGRIRHERIGRTVSSGPTIGHRRAQSCIVDAAVGLAVGDGGTTVGDR